MISGGGRRRNLGAGGGLPCGICDDAGAAVLVEGAHRDAEVPSAGGAAHPGSEQFGCLVRHLGVDDGTSTPTERFEEGVFAALTEAFDGARDGGAGEVEGAHEVGLGDAGNDVQLGDAQQHGAPVVGGVAIEGFEVEEVEGEAVVGLHGKAVADGSGVRKGEREGQDHGRAPDMYHCILAEMRIGCQEEIARKGRKRLEKRLYRALR